MDYGYQSRHLRVEEDIPSMVKRDAAPVSTPDVGQIATFTGDPQPIRGALGATFISNSNHEIDKQNVDNVAGPTTDQGLCAYQISPRMYAKGLPYHIAAGTIPNLKWSMSLSHTRLLKVCIVTIQYFT